MYHHAEGSTVMMVKWLREGPSKVPPFATTSVGVGGFVLDQSGQVLVVKERQSQASGSCQVGSIDLIVMMCMDMQCIWTCI